MVPAARVGYPNTADAVPHIPVSLVLFHFFFANRCLIIQPRPTVGLQSYRTRNAPPMPQGRPSDSPSDQEQFIRIEVTTADEPNHGMLTYIIVFKALNGIFVEQITRPECVMDLPLR